LLLSGITQVYPEKDRWVHAAVWVVQQWEQKTKAGIGIGYEGVDSGWIHRDWDRAIRTGKDTLRNPAPAKSTQLTKGTTS